MAGKVVSFPVDTKPGINAVNAKSWAYEIFCEMENGTTFEVPLPPGQWELNKKLKVKKIDCRLYRKVIENGP